MYIIVKLIKYHAKKVIKLTTVFAIGLLMMTSIIYIKYKPSYRVTVNGEIIGYVNSKEYVQKMIETYKNDISGNMAYITVNAMPRYDLEFINKKQIKDKSSEVLTAVKNNSCVTYRSYAIILNGKEKVKVSTEAEAKEVVNALSKADRKNAKISEIFVNEDQIKKDVKSLNVAKAELEDSEIEKIEKKSTKKSSKKNTKKTTKKVVKTTKTTKKETKKTVKKETKKTAKKVTKKVTKKTTTTKKTTKVTTRKSTSRKTKTTSRSSVKRTSKYTFPVKGCSKKNILNKSYPSYSGHTGVDVNSNVKGKSVVAADSGTVIVSTALKTASGSYKSYGEYIMIKHDDGTVTLYGHLKQGSRKVKKGDRVTRGQVIAKVGSTGNSTGTHLHFEVRINGRPVNPLKYL